MKLPGHWLASPWRRSVVAALAGALPMLAFPAPSLWWFAYVALVPWILLVRSAPTARRAAYDGWFGGLGFMLAVHHWLLPSLHVFTVLIAALLGALWAPWGLLVRRFLAGRASAGRIAAAARRAAVGLADGRTGPLLAGARRALGHARIQPVAGGARAAAGLGRRGVAAQLPGGGRERGGRRPGRGARVPGPGRGRARRHRRGDLRGLGVVTASGGGRPGADRRRAAGRRRRVGQRREAVRARGGAHPPAGRPGRRIWSSGARAASATTSPTGPTWRNGSRRSRATTGADILVNVDARRSDRPGIYKSSVLVGPDGPTGDRYDKMRLVPFGEYIPARSLLGWATSVGKAAGEDRKRGTEQVVMNVGHGLRDRAAWSASSPRSPT